MNDIKLKPCPFCGGEVEIETTLRAYSCRDWYGIVCRNTKNLGGTCALQIAPQASPEVAAKRWNMRVPEDDLRAALVEAREFVDHHSEPWYVSGQELLKKIDEALK
jgi:hypothetical protein